MIIQCSCMCLSGKECELLTSFLIDRPLGHCNFTDLKRKIFELDDNNITQQ